MGPDVDSSIALYVPHRSRHRCRRGVLSLKDAADSPYSRSEETMRVEVADAQLTFEEAMVGGSTQ